MVSVEEASGIIQSVLHQPAIRQVDLVESAGRVLAEPIRADRDFPPFNRVTMDGVAIYADSFGPSKKEFIIEGLQAAGTAQKKLKNQTSCMEVMTGSILPEGSNAVIRYEDVEIKNGKAFICIEEVKEGTNIHPQGSDAKKGDLLLEPGLLLSPAETALLATVGKSQVKVFACPKTAVVATGDELVNVDDMPEPHQIRRSNTYSLLAAMKEMKWDANSFYLPDNRELLKQMLETILNDHTILILSGGVSKGKLDFVPPILEELGVKKLFHEVSQRPGRPLWFGNTGDGKVVFALPGNPVSTYVCFYRYIRPWMNAQLGIPYRSVKAVLAKDFSFGSPLTYFLQVQTQLTNGTILATPIPGGGSGDFVNLKNVDGFLELPFEKNDFKAGEAYPYFSFRP